MPKQQGLGSRPSSRRNRPLIGPREGMMKRPRGLTDSDAYPGEARPLKYEPGRGPVTDDEILGVMRRRARLELAASPKRAGATRKEIPAELPSIHARKEPVMTRLPPLVTAAARARAEIEELNLAALLEAFLAEYASGTPRPPEEAREHVEAVLNELYGFDGE